MKWKRRRFVELNFHSCESDYVIVDTRVGWLPPISKHRDELEIRGKAEHFSTNLGVFWMYVSNEPVFCEKMKEKAGLIYVISSSDFQTFSTVLILFVLPWFIINEFENSNCMLICLPQSEKGNFSFFKYEFQSPKRAYNVIHESILMKNILPKLGSFDSSEKTRRNTIFAVKCI